MKTKGLLILLSIILLTSCAGFQLKDDAATNVTAYVSGRVGYVGLDTAADQVMTIDKKQAMIAELEARYSKFLTDTTGMETIEPGLSVALYNDLTLIMTGYVDDPYLLISDLTFLLQQYGGQIVNGQAVNFDPIPRSVYVSFDLGWNVSKRMVNK